MNNSPETTSAPVMNVSATPDLAAQLNRDCLCRTLDTPRLAQALGLAPDAAALAQPPWTERPHAFSATPVFVSAAAGARHDCNHPRHRIRRAPAGYQRARAGTRSGNRAPRSRPARRVPGLRLPSRPRRTAADRDQHQRRRGTAQRRAGAGPARLLHRGRTVPDIIRGTPGRSRTALSKCSAPSGAAAAARKRSRASPSWMTRRRSNICIRSSCCSARCSSVTISKP